MSIETTPTMLVAAVGTAMTVGMLVYRLAPPPRRLHGRVFPYLSPTRTFGRSPKPNVVSSVFGPIIQDIADRLGAVVDRSSRDTIVLRLRQAGWFRGMPDAEMLTRYRLAQFKPIALGLAVGGVLGWIIDASPAVWLTLIGLGFVFGATRTRGRLERNIDKRREIMRIEIYTVNQLLAMRVRVGGGVVQAVKGLIQRGDGEVIRELAEALRLHRAGWSAPDAFRRIAELSPEPFCSRTYRLLASAEERGADLAAALLALSEDVREARRDSIKRSGTRRRAAMLIPTIAILAPVLILFVAAPLPYLITSWQ